MKNSMTAITVLLSSLYCSNSVAEPVPNTNLDVHLESSSIIGSGRNINIHRLPILDTLTNTTTYYDVSFAFGVDVNGELIFERQSSIAASPALSTENFIAGTYEDGAKNQFVLNGPSTLADGRTAWSLTSEKYNAAWTTGSTIGHPNIANLNIENLGQGISYGIQSNNSWGSKNWRAGMLIGAQQAGNSITVTSFHAGYTSINYNSPQSSFTLQLVTN